jgi:hypothetical protein
MLSIFLDSPRPNFLPKDIFAIPPDVGYVNASLFESAAFLSLIADTACGYLNRLFKTYGCTPGVENYDC